MMNDINIRIEKLVLLPSYLPLNPPRSERESRGNQTLLTRRHDYDSREVEHVDNEDCMIKRQLVLHRLNNSRDQQCQPANSSISNQDFEERFSDVDLRDCGHKKHRDIQIYTNLLVGRS